METYIMKTEKVFNIDTIASLACLNLNKDEKSSLTKDLKNILSYVEKLDSLDTESVAATSHVLNIENVYREDTVCNVHAAADILAQLPPQRKEEKFFKVPKVIEDN